MRTDRKKTSSGLLTYRFSEFLYQLLSCPLPWFTWIFSLELVGVLEMAIEIGGDHPTSVLKIRHDGCEQCQTEHIEVEDSEDRRGPRDLSGNMKGSSGQGPWSSNTRQRSMLCGSGDAKIEGWQMEPDLNYLGREMEACDCQQSFVRFQA